MEQMFSDVKISKTDFSLVNEGNITETLDLNSGWLFNRFDMILNISYALILP